MRTAETDTAQPLTRREAQVLALLAAGCSRAEMAAQLTVSLSSTKFHLEHLYAKLGVHRKRQALLRAQALGLLAPAGAAAAPHPAARPQRAAPRTRLFGRDGELAQLRARLEENRLVTLVGAGGVGKTRLALAAAEALRPNFAAGVGWVELAPLSDPALVPQQVAASLGLRDQTGQPVLETLIVFLRERELLLVLDNCEHLLDSCRWLADALLRACPRVRVLATSREPLGLAGEAVYPVPSLAFPDPDHPPPLSHLTRFPAIRLLLDRARRVQPGYQVTTHNAAALMHICQRLDGLPLALEMAASQLSQLTAAALAARLDTTFRLLTGGGHGALPRQQTLRATLDWSYALLSAPERQLLQRLSVFAGGCTLPAAEAVCAGEGLPPADILDRLTALVTKSLVLADQQPRLETRYRLLEVVRQYAREKLRDAGAAERLGARHRDYYLSFAETNFRQYRSQPPLAWIAQMETERDNLRRALAWSFSDSTHVEAGPRLLIATNGPHHWFAHHEWVTWTRQGVAWCAAHPELSDQLRAPFLRMAAGLLAQDDLATGLRLQAQGVAASRRLGAAGRVSLMLSLVGLADLILDESRAVERARAPLAEAEAIFNELRPDDLTPADRLWSVIHFANQRANLENARGRYPDAKAHAEASLRLVAQSGRAWDSIGPRLSLGTACLHLGDYATARAHFLDALAQTQAWDDYRQAYCLRCLGWVDVRAGQLARALDTCRHSLRAAAQLGDDNIVASDLGLCADIAAQRGQPVRAATLSGAAQALYARQHRHPWEDSALDTLLPGWRDRPDAAALTAAHSAGQALTAEPALAYALSDDLG